MANEGSQRSFGDRNRPHPGGKGADRGGGRSQGPPGRDDRRDRESPAAQAIKQRVQKLDHFAEYPIEDMVKDAEALAIELAPRLTKTQMRKVYGFVRRMEARGEAKEASQQEKEVRTQALLLKPKLAYTSAREPASKPIFEAWDPCLDKVKNPEDMLAFARFAESIVAYFEARAFRN